MRPIVMLLLLVGCPPKTPPEPSPDEEDGPQTFEVGLARGWGLRAQRAELRGDLQEADRSFGWMVRVDRANPWTHVHQGRFFERQRRWEEAIDAYVEALEREAGLPEAELGLGRALIGNGELDVGWTHVKTAAASGLPEAMGMMARHALASGDEKTALAWVHRWPAATLWEKEQRGRLAARLGDWEVARDMLIEVVEVGDPAPDLVDQVVHAGIQTCRLDRVWSWGRTQASLSTEAEPWLELARVTGDRAWQRQLLEGDDLALSRVELRRDPESVVERLDGADSDEARMLRVRALELLGRHRQVIETAPESVEGELARLRSLAALQRNDEATRGARELFREHPRDARVAAALGVLLAGRGEVGAAEALVSRPLDWTSDTERAVALAGIQQAAGRVDAAREVIRAADTAGAWSWWAGHGPDEDREDAWAAVVRLDPSDAEAWLALYRLGDDAALSRAMEADPCFVPALVARARSAPPCEALSVWDRAVDARPGDPDLRRERLSARSACQAR